MPDMFDLDALLKGVAETTAKKVAATQNLNQTREVETRKMADSAGQLASQAQQSLDRLGKMTEAGTKAKGLAKSDSLIDRMTLLGEQILDPMNFTRQGRAAQRAEVSQELAVTAQAHGLIAQGSQAKIAAASAQVDAATAEQAMQFEQIRASNLMTQAYSEHLSLQTEMKNQYLLNKTSKELEAIAAQPVGKDGYIAVDGVRLTPLEVREQQKNMEVREKLAVLSPSVTDPQYAIKLAAFHESQLAFMKPAELRNLRKNGGVMQDGTQVNPDILDKFIARADAASLDEINQQQNQYIASQGLGLTVQTAGAAIQQMEANIDPASPMAAALATYKGEVALLAKANMNPEFTDDQRVAALQRHALAQQNFYKQAEKESIRLAGSDKDLQGIMFARLTGQEPDPVLFEEVLTNRLADRKPIGNILPPAQSKRLGQLYDQYLAASASQNGQVSFVDAMSGSGPDKKQMRIDAAKAATAKLGKEIIDSEATKFQVESLRLDGHPLKGWLPAQMEALMTASSEAAWGQIQKNYNLSNGEMKTLRQGGEVEGRNGQEIREAAEQEAFQQEFYAYERAQTGLGTAVADWYAQNANTMLTRQVQNLDPSIRPLASQYVTDMSQKIIEGWSTAKNRIAMESAKNTSEFLTSSRDTYFNNALTLQMDSSLQPEQRTLLMNKVINPAIEQAKQAGLPEEKIPEYVEQVIRAAKPEDPDIKRALQQHLLGRMTLMSNLDMLRDEFMRQHWRQGYLGAAGNWLYQQMWGDDADAAYKNQNSALGWAYPGVKPGQQK